TNNYVTGRPTTDLLLNFEDFILYAINYGVVSGPSRMKPLASTQSDVLSMTVSSSGPDRVTAHLILSGSGALQGLSTALNWNADVLEPVAYGTGDYLTSQHGTALSAAPGSVDAAIPGLRGQGLSGTGEV